MIPSDTAIATIEPTTAEVAALPTPSAVMRVRIPAAQGEFRRAELRSPDPSANPYLVFALLIYAAVDGLEKKMEPPEPADLNLYKASAEVLAKFRKLPEDLNYARALAKSSGFVRQKLPRDIIEAYCR